MKKLAIKVDVDTERGTKLGVPNLVNIFKDFGLKATFLFALGPDNTGRAIARIFKPNFFKKVKRTSVIANYGLKTLGNGLLWPAPHISKKHSGLLRSVHDYGFEVGIHCYDHIKWQDNLHKMTEAEVRSEVNVAFTTFKNVFGFSAKSMGSAGWQANKYSLAAYDDCNLTYASDTRGSIPFFPVVGKREFNTLQVPSTLPTLDEFLGQPNYNLENIKDYFISQIKEDQANVFTIHAELEGMKYLNWFTDFIKSCLENNIEIVPVRSIALELLKNRHKIPKIQLVNKEIFGRSGTVASHL
jgi:undecaprenyl phosphate-alpha-L-ara4FN deformylase